MLKNRLLNNNFNDRHIAITDGIFAIAMTILVLEISVPTISEINSIYALGEYLTGYLLPAIIMYFISFYLVYNFWETNIILFNFKKLSNNVLFLNSFALGLICLIPFATGFLFNFYNYFEVNIFFSLLILFISIIYLLMLIMAIRDNFSEVYENKEELKSKFDKKISEGFIFPNLKIYMKGAILTLFYLTISPIITSIISIILSFISPVLSILSFILVLIMRFIIRMKRITKESNKLTDSEREFLKDIEDSIYN